MKRKLIYVLMMLFLTSFVNGASCLNLNFEVLTSNVTDNSTFVLKIESVGGTPMNPWEDYQNLNLTYDKTKFVNLGSDYVNLSDFVTNTHQWSLNTSNVGDFDFNVSVEDNLSVSCNLNLSINVLPSVIEPNVTLSFDGFDNIMNVSEDYVFTLILNNSGYGNAFNLSGLLSSVRNLSLNSSNVSILEIENRSLESIDYIVSSSVCGANSVEVTVANSYDSFGNILIPINSISESFEVVGSDIDVLENSFIFTKVGSNPVTSVIFNVSLKNIGLINSSNSSIGFYFSSYSNLIEEVSVGEILVNETKNISFVWNSPLSGSHVIKSFVNSSNECPNLDREDMGTLVSIPSVASSGGGSSGGGSSSGSIISDIETQVLVNDSESVDNITVESPVVDNESIDNVTVESPEVDTINVDNVTDIVTTNSNNNNSINPINSERTGLAGYITKNSGNFWLTSFIVLVLLIQLVRVLYRRYK